MQRVSPPIGTFAGKLIAFHWCMMAIFPNKYEYSKMNESSRRDCFQHLLLFANANSTIYDISSRIRGQGYNGLCAIIGTCIRHQPLSICIKSKYHSSFQANFDAHYRGNSEMMFDVSIYQNISYHTGRFWSLMDIPNLYLLRGAKGSSSHPASCVGCALSCTSRRRVKKACHHAAYRSRPADAWHTT